MSEYKCESHKLDLACSGCIRAHIAKKEKLLEFVKTLGSSHMSDEEFVEFSKDYPFVTDDELQARKLLKELGEI